MTAAAGENDGAAQRHRAVAADRRPDPAGHRLRRVRATGCRRNSRWPRASASTGTRCAARSPRWCRRACCAPSRAAAPLSRNASGFAYPIGARTRFSEGLEGQARDRRGILLRHAVEAAEQRTAEALGLAAGATVLRLETLSEADGRPVSRATSFFDATRFDGIEKAYARQRLDHRRASRIRRLRLSPPLDADLGAPCRAPPTSPICGCRPARSCW